MNRCHCGNPAIIKYCSPACANVAKWRRKHGVEKPVKYRCGKCGGLNSQEVCYVCEREEKRRRAMKWAKIESSI